jgi:hypothetical protein
MHIIGYALKELGFKVSNRSFSPSVIKHRKDVGEVF